MRRISEPRALLSAAVATTLVVATAALLGCGSDGPAAAGVAESGASASVDRSAQPVMKRLRRDFVLFRRQRSSRDRLPARLVPPSEAIRRWGLDPGASRLAYGGPFSQIYVIPGRRFICLTDTRGAASNCWPRATVEKGNAANISFCPPSLPPRTMQMAGLFPDGIRKVRVVMEDGRREVAPVTQNLMLLDLPFGRTLPSRIIWRRGDEVHNQIVVISSRVARLACAPPGRPRP
ncbi:MAG TPA: hypothetical protein VKA35_02540 [Solirubrobacterales bacterium]|nr:hypothetical protein [Solirubrobacterales bacterium]